jgi:hypothetical protein
VRPPGVTLGARVQVELVDERAGVEALDLVLVPDADAALARGYLGQGTPLGRAIVGQQAGSSLPYKQGDIVAVRVLSVVPDDVPDADAAAVRQAVIQQAVERSEALDIARLALTVDVKWGFLRPRRHPIRRRGVARPRRDLHVDALNRAPVDAG